MILILDNHDSFTHNLVQQVASLGFEVKVILSDEADVAKVRALAPAKLILSPGPKGPKDAGHCLEVIAEFYDKIPMLGVCLGHQCLAQAFGARIKRSKKPIHGQATLITHQGGRLFNGVTAVFKAAQYHSLIIDQAPLDFMTTATDDVGEIMAIEHKTLPLFGVQFHPESFLTKQGERIVANFLNIQA